MAENLNGMTIVDVCLPISDFNKICETVYGIQRKVRLWAYVNQSLLWMNMAENQKCITFSVSLQYHIFRTSVQWFMP
jgi:hypothetical protein